MTRAYKPRNMTGGHHLVQELLQNDLCVTILYSSLVSSLHDLKSGTVPSGTVAEMTNMEQNNRWFQSWQNNSWDDCAFYQLIWRCPKMGVPMNHPFID